jgi:hypothetical protein
MLRGGLEFRAPLPSQPAMTIYKTVLSWLVFFILAFLGWETLRDFDVSSFLFGSLIYILALAIVVPWLRSWSVRFPCLKLGMWISESVAENLNMAGRWTLAVLCASLVLQGGFFMALFLAFLIAPEISILSSYGFTRFIDAVFFPGGREAKPPYTLKLARFYVEKHRWEEAETEYARVLSFHPEQVEAWQERLTLAFRRRDTSAGSTPERVLAEALKVLKAPTDREAVYQQFIRGGPVYWQVGRGVTRRP